MSWVNGGWGKGEGKKSRKNKMAFIMSNISYAVFLMAMGSESIEGGGHGGHRAQEQCI